MTGEWKVHKGKTPKQVRVTIEPDGLRLFARAVRRHYDELFTHGWLSKCSVVLNYEELTADPRRCFAERICPLLGLAPLVPVSQMVKQNTRPIKDRAQNYQEVEKLVREAAFYQHYSWLADKGWKARRA
jgi:hypothetical protein